MSERLEKELNKLKYANIQRVSENEYFIKKEDGIRIFEDKCYLIKVNNRIKNADNVYATNWNNGRFPK